MKVGFVQFSNGGIVRGAGYVVASMLRSGHQVMFYDINKQRIQELATTMVMDKVGETLHALLNPSIQSAIDMIYEHKSNQMIDAIIRNKCELVAVSATTLDMPLAAEIITEIKSKSRIPVILGGIHPTIIGGKILEQYPQIDYLCIGEGESMILDVISTLGTPEIETVENLAYRKDGKVIVNRIRPPEDLSALPAFPWYIYAKNKVVNEDGWIYVTATRGCPYRCTYCCNEAYLKHYGSGYLRKRPLDQIIAELLQLKYIYKPKLLYFGDEMLLWDKDYAKGLFNAIKNYVGIPFGFMARVEYINKEVVDLAADCGCKYVGMGVECGDEYFRRAFLNRNMTNKQIEDAFRLFREKNIFTTSFNMIGYPFDNDNELTEATIDLNRNAKPDFVQTSVFYPFPGTELYNRCIKNDLIDKTKLTQVSSYMENSILKGVSLRKKQKEIDKIFNSRANWRNHWAK